MLLSLGLQFSTSEELTISNINPAQSAVDASWSYQTDYSFGDYGVIGLVRDVKPDESVGLELLCTVTVLTSGSSGTFWFNITVGENEDSQQNDAIAKNNVVVEQRNQITLDGTGSVTVLADVDVGIFAIATSSELSNTAVLSGIEVSSSVSVKRFTMFGSTLTDVAPTSRTCYSSNNDVIKVSEHCHAVILRGNELTGGSTVSVFFQVGLLESKVAVSVWFPSIPLTVSLSSSNLHQISDWEVSSGLGSCVAKRNRYQQTHMRASANFTKGPSGNSYTVDVMSYINTIESQNPNIADLKSLPYSSVQVVEGKTPGSSFIEFKGILKIMPQYFD